MLPGSILSTDHMWAKFFLGISLLQEVFPSPQNPALLNSNSTRNARTHNTWASCLRNWVTTPHVIELWFDLGRKSWEQSFKLYCLLTSCFTALDCRLIFASVTNHVWGSKITHHKWILATLDSFTHLQTRTERVVTSGQYLLLNKPAKLGVYNVDCPSTYIGIAVFIIMCGITMRNISIEEEALNKINVLQGLYLAKINVINLM